MMNSHRNSEIARLRKEAGRTLKEMREAKHLTQRQLAERIGVDYHAFIGQIESGRGRIPPERYEAFAKALDLPTRKFVKTMMRYYDPVTYKHLFEKNVP